MTPRAWSYGLLFAGIAWAALIVAWWLIVAAQTVGVEAWHDSALPQVAFVAIRSAGVSTPAPTLRQSRTPSPAASAPATVPPSLRRIAAVRVPTATVTAVQRGTASTYGPAFGPGWLAVPRGPGIRVRVCGAARCIERTSTDAVPDLASQRAGRIVDLSVHDFELVTGLDWTRGLAPVTVEELAP